MVRNFRICRSNCWFSYNTDEDIFVRSRKTEDGRWKSEDGSRKSGVRSRKSGVRRRKKEEGRWKMEDGRRKSEIGKWEMENENLRLLEWNVFDTKSTSGDINTRF
jgi:hypothetical protein